MYNHAPENYKCPLCQIAKGEETHLGNQEKTVLFRNDDITVFVAGKWLRSNPGHVIIIPNKHIENLYDMEDTIGHKIFDMSKKVAIALKEAYKCDGTSIRQHNEPAGNQDAFHYHMHIFPRYVKDGYYSSNEKYWPTIEEKLPYVNKLKPYFDKLEH